MKEELSIDIIGLAGAYSYALDCIEAELVNIKNKHGKRVAYIKLTLDNDTFENTGKSRFFERRTSRVLY